ncbi:hypothetical protein CAPTEDRAFT_207207 [Capitella teleta]|uniref:Uncharacterized protein n=1 Tax=Capitella teleta TaxID=283909 RepID=R7T7E5_CAPTE|nr:hypothetical protein CAPTEDRAFT_207207 [Capitella teleta]|eukprot:ELT89333.1 hypothetical protein CAPTEDRAFT_207207 [Capitella teleta]
MAHTGTADCHSTGNARQRASAEDTRGNTPLLKESFLPQIMPTDCTVSEFTKRWITYQWDNIKGVRLGSFLFPGVNCAEYHCEDVLRYIQCGVRYVAVSQSNLLKHVLTVVDEFLKKNPGEVIIVGVTKGDSSNTEIWRTVHQIIGHRLSLLSTSVPELTMEAILGKYSLLLVTDTNTVPYQLHGRILQYTNLELMSILKTNNETLESITVWRSLPLDNGQFFVIYLLIFAIIVIGIASRFQRKKFHVLAFIFLIFLALGTGSYICLRSLHTDYKPLALRVAGGDCMNQSDLLSVGNAIDDRPGLKFTTGEIPTSVSLAVVINTQKLCHQDEVVIINDSTSKCPKYLKPRPLVYVIASRDEGSVITSNEIPDGGHVVINQRQYPMDALLLVYAGASSGWKMVWSEFLHPLVENYSRCVVRAVEDETGAGFACVAAKINADCCDVGDRHNRISAIEWTN